MDISKFNNELRIKITKANGYEKNKMLREAVSLWIEISEMTLKASQVPGLDFSYRSMLIKKTEQIVDHIKDLKSKRMTPIIEEHKIDLSFTQLEPEEISDGNNIKEPTPIPKIQSNTLDDFEKKEVVAKTDESITENSEFANLPIGFKEIKAPEDFHILTPHDEEYVQKRTSQEIDMSVFKPQKETNTQEDDGIEQVKIELDKPEDENKIFCFACGQEQPSDVKICKSCGTLLDK